MIHLTLACYIALFNALSISFLRSNCEAIEQLGNASNSITTSCKKFKYDTSMYKTSLTADVSISTLAKHNYI